MKYDEKYNKIRSYDEFQEHTANTRAVNLVEALTNLDSKPYVPIVKTCSRRLNMNNLNRIIKVYLINKRCFDEEEDELLIKNIPKLRKFMLNRSTASQLKGNKSNSTNKKYKTLFKIKTLKKFNSASGKYFGVPV